MAAMDGFAQTLFMASLGYDCSPHWLSKAAESRGDKNCNSKTLKEENTME